MHIKFNDVDVVVHNHTILTKDHLDINVQHPKQLKKLH